MKLNLRFRITMKILFSLPFIFASILGAPNIPIALRKSQSIDGRIVGGEPVTIEQFPYQVSAQFFGTHWCGGVIISDRYVISAAHCFEWPTWFYSIRAGATLHHTGGQVIEIEEYYNHPDFDPAKRNFDISVLLLTSSLIFGPSVATIPLPVQAEYLPEGTQAFVSGWGALYEGGPFPEQLHAVSVPIVSNERCNIFYNVIGWTITETMICAGYDEGGRDACNMDSGGPLTANGQLVGIVSWGAGCAQPNFPGVYANVANLRSFITEISGI